MKEMATEVATGGKEPKDTEYLDKAVPAIQHCSAVHLNRITL